MIWRGNICCDLGELPVNFDSTFEREHNPVFLDGLNAYLSDVPRGDNPHSQSPNQCFEWALGWDNGRDCDDAADWFCQAFPEVAGHYSKPEIRQRLLESGRVWRPALTLNQAADADNSGGRIPEKMSNDWFFLNLF